MNVEEAVLWLKRYQGYEPFKNGTVLKHSFDLTDETVDVILSAIGGANIGEPLTLEQLREMERHTPVWAEVENKTIEGWDGYWCLCVRGKILTPGLICVEAEKMEGIKFYSYSPDRIDREAWTAEWIKCDGYTECSKCEHWYDSPESEDDGDRPAFCPSCGRAMTPEALTELENRLMGSNP